MKKFLPIIVASFPLLFLLFGFEYIGEKTTNVSIIYIISTLIAFLLFIAFHFGVKNKDKWFYILFGSVCVVNIGYYLLSVSTTLNQALIFNSLSYLGSVFLPLSMLMVIMNITNIKPNRYLKYILVGVALLLFGLTASPSFSNLYYENIAIESVNGITILNKVYGKLHCMYLFYLVAYFTAMLSIITYSIVKKKISSSIHASSILFAVLVNIGVWTIEQVVKLDFEILSISYIISELFLLGIHLLLEEKDNIIFGTTRLLNMPSYSEPVYKNTQIIDDSNKLVLTEKQIELCSIFTKGLLDLTPAEQTLYEHYISGKKPNEIIKLMNIQKNTLKFHNKNLYRKLGVSSYKELIEVNELVKASEYIEKTV